MEFLLEFGLTNEDIDNIKKVNSKGIINNVIINRRNVYEVVSYLKEIGINDKRIKDLFIQQIGIFFKSKAELEQVFEEYEIESITKSLNYDVNTVDLIEFE